MGRQPVTVSDAVGRAERNLQQGQQNHAARIAAEIAALPDAQRRVVESRQRLASYTHRPSYRVQDGEAHPERAAKAAEGVEAVPLVPPAPRPGQRLAVHSDAETTAGPVRYRVRAPMTLRAETSEALARAIEEQYILGEKARLTTEAAAQGNATLDKVLNENEHDAFEILIRDAVTIARANSPKSCLGDRSSRPSDEQVRRALARMKHIREALPLKHWETLEGFIKDMLLELNENRQTLAELNLEYGGSRDSRAEQPVYRTRLKTIAEGLHEKYLDYQIIQRRIRDGLAAPAMIDLVPRLGVNRR